MSKTHSKSVRIPFDPRKNLPTKPQKGLLPSKPYSSIKDEITFRFKYIVPDFTQSVPPNFIESVPGDFRQSVPPDFRVVYPLL